MKQHKRANREYVPGFNLPIDLQPKPNSTEFTKPKLIKGVLTSKIIKG